MIINLKTPSYFHRDYENDLPVKNGNDFVAQAMRLVKVALPFISLYRPLGRTLAVGSGLLRMGTVIYQGVTLVRRKNEKTTVKSWLNLGFTVASVAGTTFSHPLGMVLSSSQDIGLGLYKIRTSINDNEKLEATKQMMHLVHNVFYLFAMMYASMELKVASLGMLVIAGSVSSTSEFKKGHLLEGCAELVMAAVRTHQLLPQVQQLREKWEIEAAVKRVYVGSLREKWQFPSDHLPIGVKVGNFRVVSWNVLNNAYISWVTEKDSQGLNGSMISDLNVKIRKDGFTARDAWIIQMIHAMMHSSADVIALQECGKPFLATLQETLPSNWSLVKSTDRAIMDQDVIVYNKSLFSYVSDRSETAYEGYPSQPGRPIQNAVFAAADQQENIVRIINGHIPGEPLLPCRDEFARYVRSFYVSGEITVALGDNNFERQEMIDAYEKAGFSDFALHSPWHTNIDPYTKESKAIDHIFVLGAPSRDLRPEEILDESSHLRETVELLSQENAELPRTFHLPNVSKR